MSLYQKYRARVFSELFAQDHVTTVLKFALREGSYGHAYLLVGTRGAGKTSLARIFARAMNCEDVSFVRSHGEPCNRCKSCSLSLAGNHPDIIEMDAASNRGIEEIRSLKESASFVPSFGRKKIYVVDEVHMMTKEAFNALLKTLEEPPEHVVFVLCTTEMHRLPSTIISRSMVFELRNATVEDLLSKINFILHAEKRFIDEEGKLFIAKLGKGSFRDAESILEKVLMSVPKDHITYEDVVNCLGYSHAAIIGDFFVLLQNKDLISILKFLDEKIDGSNLDNFNHQLCDLVYQDIMDELSDTGKVSRFKIELFDYLCSVEKDIKNSLNPKVLYIAKILKFISEYSKERLSSKDSDHCTKSEQNYPVDILNETKESNKGSHKDRSGVGNNHRTKKNNGKEFHTSPIRKVKDDAEKVKIDSPVGYSSDQIRSLFLGFLKSKNRFLYNFFHDKEFLLVGNEVQVYVSSRMDVVLLTKPSVKTLMDDFASQIGGSITFVPVMKDSDSTAPTSTKVENLGDDEIKNIFDAESMEDLSLHLGKNK